MKLEKWALIAEIVSGAAIVVTLLFLVLGIRDNTEVLRATAYANLQNGLNEFQIAQMSDPELSRGFGQFINGDAADLSDLDQGRLGIGLAILFRNLETAYFMNKYELLGESEWERFEDSICRNRGRLQRYLGDDLIRGTMSSEFMGYIGDTCTN